MSERKNLVTIDMVGERKFLSSLCEAAKNRCDQVANPDWKRAYISLAKAADHCDAVVARSSHTPELNPND